jgi:hypothetical protein
VNVRNDLPDWRTLLDMALALVVLCVFLLPLWGCSTIPSVPLIPPRLPDLPPSLAKIPPPLPSLTSPQPKSPVTSTTPTR